jgi:hypothetical protein
LKVQLKVRGPALCVLAGRVSVHLQGGTFEGDRAWLVSVHLQGGTFEGTFEGDRAWLVSVHLQGGTFEGTFGR